MIETIEYKNFAGFTGDSHKVGVSKPLSELSVNDIIDFDKYVCGAINNFVNVQNIGVNPQISLPVDSDNKIMYSTALSWDNTYFCSKKTQNKIYMRSLLLVVPSNKAYRDYIFTHADNDVKIVTELTDYQDLFITINESITSSRYTTAGIVSTGKNTETYTDTLETGENIIPVWIISDGVNAWINSGIIYNGYYCKAGNNLTNQGFSNAMKTFTESNDLYLMWGYNPNDTNDVVKCKNIIPDDTVVQLENNGCTFGIKITYSTTTPLSAIELLRSDIKYNETQYFDNNPLIHISAYYGMYIRSTSKHKGSYIWYKPIITGGMVTGYTTDMNAKSDIDDWKILENHNIPIIPPNTNSDEDDIESVGYGYFSNAVMGTLYSLYNKLDLEKIAQWFYNQTEKIDIANNVISLKEIPFSLSTLNIVPLDTDLKIGGVNVTYNNENIKVGQIVSPATTSVSVIFGEFNIPRLSNTFLDYSPYTKYELLLPFAPTPVTLPDWCVNKTVSAIFLYDIYTTACQYVIECNGERICSVSGIFGVDRPISAQNVALKDASRLSSQVATASSVLGGVMSATTGNIGGIMSGAIGGVSALSQMLLSGKQNYMYTVGANGDSSSVGLCHAVHLKITRTLSAEDSNFNHVYGRLLCKYKKLSSVTGYTKCDNVNTTGLTCSEMEKQRIKQLLETGIYI